MCSLGPHLWEAVVCAEAASSATTTTDIDDNRWLGRARRRRAQRIVVANVVHGVEVPW